MMPVNQVTRSIMQMAVVAKCESQQGVQGDVTVILISTEDRLGVSRWWSCEAYLELARQGIGQ